MKTLNILSVVLFFSITALMSCGEDDSLTFEEQLETDISKIQTYIDDNEIPATLHESGIFYVIDSPGSGEAPSSVDVVQVDYEGRLFNGEVFDSSREREIKPEFPLDNLILSWQIMLPLIREGGSIRIYAPSGYCYGRNSTGIIDANSNLIFEIDLLVVNP